MVWIAHEFLLPSSWLKIEINEWIMKKKWLEWQKAIFTLLRDCIRQIDAMLPCVCSVVDHRWYHNVVRRECRTGLRLVCHFFYSCYVLTSSVICYWTEARRPGIYLLVIPTPERGKNKKVVTFLPRFDAICDILLNCHTVTLILLVSYDKKEKCC